jgi:HSP20 family protein
MSITVASEPAFGGVARQMGKLLDQFQKGYSNFAPSDSWTPNVNLYETDVAYLVCVDLSGVEKEKIDITVENHLLKLHGNRTVPVPNSGGESRIRVHLMEIDHGAFSREVELPLDVQQDKIAAHHRNGLLWIELPKK